MSNLQSPAVTYNAYQTLQTYQEGLSSELAHLTIDNDTPVNFTYSTLDRVEINNTLDITFGRDIDGRQIRCIITEFLGYSSSGSACARIKNLVKKCNALIQINNQNKPITAKAAVILQTSFDESEILSRSSLLPQIEQLAKSYYVAFRVIGFRGETLGEAICKVAKELGHRSIMTLIVRAHGVKYGILLGNKSFYTVSNARAEDFAYLDPGATIILDACYAGIGLGKKISAIQSRSVFAYNDESYTSLLTPCCDNHGDGVVAFNKFKKQIARRFTSKSGCVTEAIPCCATEEGIEKIKKVLLRNTVFAAESGDAIAQYDLGIDYSDGLVIPQSHVKAEEWYLKSAKQGYAIGQYNLAVVYERGKGVPQSHVKAVEWYLKAAEQGHASAQNNLGIAYERGNGVPQSHVKAVAWYLKAAKQGKASAQHNLGNAYERGKGVPQSHVKAIEWYLKAAERGFSYSQINLGLAYYNGTGVDKSFDEAIKWMRKAAEQGSLRAKFFLAYFSLLSSKL